MASQLSLYNGALRMLGERKLGSLTENRESRRLLDDAWDDNARRYCLEQGQWTFAMRTIQITSTPDVTPEFGYRYAFDKPTDWVRTSGLSTDEYLNVPLLQYRDEAGFWFADWDTLYVRYVSDDSQYGLDYSNWPETFTRWVESYLALQVAPHLTTLAAPKLDALEKMARKLLVDARSKCAMNEATTFPPTGSWASARRARSVFVDRAHGKLTG